MLSKQKIETDLKDRDVLLFLLTDWFEKYTNSPAEDSYISAICYVK